MLDELPYRIHPDERMVADFLRRLHRQYPFLTVRSLGQSVLGRPVWALQLGESRERVLFAGAFHGMEWLTASLRQAVALLDKAQWTHLSETLERELRQRDSGGGKTDRRVNGAVERQRQATRQTVRPR